MALLPAHLIVGAPPDRCICSIRGPTVNAGHIYTTVRLVLFFMPQVTCEFGLNADTEEYHSLADITSRGCRSVPHVSKNRYLHIICKSI